MYNLKIVIKIVCFLIAQGLSLSFSITYCQIKADYAWSIIKQWFRLPKIRLDIFALRKAAFPMLGTSASCSA